MIKKTFIMIVLWIIIQAMYAQKIEGYVYDTNKKPISGANIIVKGTTNGTSSDENGFFVLQTKSNDIDLVINCIGYEENICNANSSKSNIFFLKEKNNYLNTVVVTGTGTNRTLKNTPILTKVITSEQLQNIGATTVLDALESTLPSVHFDPDPNHGDQMKIQGLGNNYNLILVDGERMAPDRAESVNYSRLNIADVERIEILQGASSVLYGSNAIGMVINIITKRSQQKVSGFLQGRISKFKEKNADAMVSLNIQNLYSKTYYNFKRKDGYKLDPSKGYAMNPYRDMSVSEKLGYKFNQHLDAEIDGTYYNRYRLNPPGSKKTTHANDKNYTINGKVNYKFSDINALQLSYHEDILRQYIVRPNLSPKDSLKAKNIYTTYKIQDSWKPSDKFEIIGGYEHNRESAYSTNLFSGSNKNIKERKAYNHNVFAQATVSLIKNLDVVPGIRYIKHKEFGSHLSPSISAMYQLTNYRFRGGISNGFKAPTMLEMYYDFDHGNTSHIKGNTNLKPETNWYKYISAEYIKPKFNASVSFYHNRLSDKISMNMLEKKPGDNYPIWSYENFSAVRIRGIDLSIQWMFLNQFTFNGAYSFADAKDKKSKRQLSGNSKHNATGTLSFNHQGLKLWEKNYPFTLALTGKYTSPRIYYAKTGEENKSNTYSIWRFNYTQQVPVYKKVLLDLQLGIDNIFDYVDDSPSYNSINPGRTYSFMARINF